MAARSDSTVELDLAATDMQKCIQPGKLTYVVNWYYYFGQRKLLKPPTMAL
jgi:hypothetical protein